MLSQETLHDPHNRKLRCLTISSTGHERRLHDATYIIYIDLTRFQAHDLLTCFLWPEKLAIFPMSHLTEVLPHLRTSLFVPTVKLTFSVRHVSPKFDFILNGTPHEGIGTKQQNPTRLGLILKGKVVPIINVLSVLRRIRAEHDKLSCSTSHTISIVAPCHAFIIPPRWGKVGAPKVQVDRANKQSFSFFDRRVRHYYCCLWSLSFSLIIGRHRVCWAGSILRVCSLSINRRI